MYTRHITEELMCHFCRVHRATGFLVLARGNRCYSRKSIRLTWESGPAKGKQSWNPSDLRIPSNVQASPFSLSPKVYIPSPRRNLNNYYPREGKKYTGETESSEKLARRQRVRVEGRQKSE